MSIHYEHNKRKILLVKREIRLMIRMFFFYTNGFRTITVLLLIHITHLFFICTFIFQSCVLIFELEFFLNIFAKKGICFFSNFIGKTN